MSSDDQSIDVSIIVVSFNTRDMTLAALRSILAETKGVRFEMIVVDNASRDGSAEAISTLAPRVRLIEAGANLGFAAANNLAVRQARGQYVLLINPDTVVLDRAIDRLVSFARANPAARIWGGRTQFADGRLNPASCWARVTLWSLLCRAGGLTGLFPRSRIFNGDTYGGWRRDRVARVDIVSGCFFLIGRADWDRLGGFDPRFFMYGEEADLCQRAHALGARPMITPDATIIHHGGASETARVDKMVKLLAAKAALIDRHFAPTMKPLALALNAGWPLSRAIASRLSAGVLGSKSHANAAATWAEIWRRREEWRRGWPDTQAHRTTLPAAPLPQP